MDEFCRKIGEEGDDAEEEHDAEAGGGQFQVQGTQIRQGGMIGGYQPVVGVGGRDGREHYQQMRRYGSCGGRQVDGGAEDER